MECARSYDPDLASSFTSLVSSCGKPATTLKVPTTSPYVSSATATATAHACTGTMVPVSSADKCDDFALSHNIGTEQLLSLNGLTSGCVGFPGGKSSLCIEGSCKTHAVAKNDTCAGIAQAAGISTIQFLTWNPMLSIPNCDADLARMVSSDTAGVVVCVGNPQPYTTPDLPWYTPPPSTMPTPTSTGIGFDQLESLTSVWTHEPLGTATITTSAPWMMPTYDLADGSLSGCYYMFNNPVDKLSCHAAAGRYAVDEETWVRWNPSVQHGDVNETGTCYLEANTQYCGLFWNPDRESTACIHL